MNIMFGLIALGVATLGVLLELAALQKHIELGYDLSNSATQRQRDGSFIAGLFVLVFAIVFAILGMVFR